MPYLNTGPIRFWIFGPCPVIVTESDIPCSCTNAYFRPRPAGISFPHSSKVPWTSQKLFWILPESDWGSRRLTEVFDLKEEKLRNVYLWVGYVKVIRYRLKTLKQSTGQILGKKTSENKKGSSTAYMSINFMTYIRHLICVLETTPIKNLFYYFVRFFIGPLIIMV